ncbi:unnamed protein product [Prorocentrum cordatum]|uniref:Protein xylosyltransferase n=1 Tax=Prorocentrum cordatum TaxID=2364126 RepID=A0ABN9QUS3_9DINO|nr:unnamed protein product [Polarella glacialis]
MAVLSRAVLAAACFCSASGLGIRADSDEGGNMTVDAAACAAQLDEGRVFMADVVDQVGMGNYSRDVATAWHAYQDKMAQQLLSEHADGHRKKPYRTLVVSAVHDTEAMVEIFETNMKRLLANKHGDKFDFALFHIDSGTTEWKKHSWYRNSALFGGKVVKKTLGAGCKPQFWAQITPQVASKYDYLWLLDEDIQLDFLNWDFYRTVLSTVDPVVSQPVIIPKAPHMRATGVTKLVMQPPRSDKFMMAYETQRSEVQAPVISTKIWPAVWERNQNNDRRNDWYIDDFWDVVAFLGEAKCHKTGVLAVNGAPVRHMDCHNLFKGTKCVEGCGDNDANCAPVSKQEESLVRDALKEAGCDVAQDWSSMCEGKQIHDCHTMLWERSRRQSWNIGLFA